jgi:hypothetical protein
MLYMIHHPKQGHTVDLSGESARDVMACRFDCSLADMIALAETLRTTRRQRYGLDTATLYISERGRTVVHISQARTEGRA